MHCIDAPRALLGLLLGTSITLSAQAGRPLQTEDAGVLDRGACEVEGAVARLSAEGTTASERALQIGCGLGWNSQLALGAASVKDGGDREKGLALAGKTALWTGPGDDPAALSLAWGLQWLKADGDTWRHAGSDLNLVYSRPLAAELTLHANLGHARDRAGRQDSTSWAVALEHAGFGSLAPMAEVFGDDRQAPWWNLGLRWTAVPERVDVDLSYGRQMVGGRPRLVTLGFKFAF